MSDAEATRTRLTQERREGAVRSSLKGATRMTEDIKELVEWAQEFAGELRCDLAFPEAAKLLEIAQALTRLTQERGEIIEECARVADKFMQQEAKSRDKASRAGRTNVASHRQAGLETAHEIGNAIRARGKDPKA